MSTIKYAYARFCRERFALPTERQVSAVEAAACITLPDDFRQYILEFNGGYFTEPDIEPTTEGCPNDCLTFMHGIGASHESAQLGDLQELAIFKETVDQKPDVLPIGYTLMGNFILLITQRECWGDIILRTFDESFFLAGNIEEFFGLLREPG